MNLSTQLASQKANSSNGKGELFSSFFFLSVLLKSNSSQVFPRINQLIISIIIITIIIA